MSAPESQRLLKAHSVQGGSSRIAFNFDDLREQCDAYLAKTRAHAEKLVGEAHSQVEEIKRTAHAAGYAEGRQAGMKEADRILNTRSAELANEQTNSRLRTTLPALEAAVAALHIERDRWLAWWESAAVRLSVAMAEKLLRHELARHPKLLPGRIKELLELAAGHPNIRIRMHPQDVEQLRECAAELLDRLSPLGQAALTGDDRITRGGCIIETQHGTIDGRVETQFERITSELLEG